MGSLLSVIAVTVAANAPAALEGAAVKVSTGMSGDSAARLRAIRSGGKYRIPS